VPVIGIASSEGELTSVIKNISSLKVTPVEFHSQTAREVLNRYKHNIFKYLMKITYY